MTQDRILIILILMVMLTLILGLSQNVSQELSQIFSPKIVIILITLTVYSEKKYGATSRNVYVSSFFVSLAELKF